MRKAIFLLAFIVYPLLAEGQTFRVDAGAQVNIGARAAPKAPEDWHGRFGSVVQIQTNLGLGKGALGTGAIVVHSGRRVVVTAAHVVRGAKTVSVRLATGSVVAVRVLLQDTLYDVAILDGSAIPPEFKGGALSPGDPGTGERLWILGFGGTKQLTSAESRVIRRDAPRAGLRGDWCELQGRTVPGDSGGPLINEAGQIAAILWGGRDGSAQAVVQSRARRLLEQLSQAWTVEQAGGMCIGGSCGIGASRGNEGRPVYPAQQPPSYIPPPGYPTAPVQPTPPPQQLPLPPPVMPDPVDLSPITTALGNGTAAANRQADAAEAGLGIAQKAADAGAQHAAAAERSAAAAEQQAAATAEYYAAQTDLLRKQQAAEAQKALAPLATDAVQGWKQGGLSGAAYELTDEGSVDASAHWLTQAIVMVLGLLGIGGPITLFAARLGLPWLISVGLGKVNTMLKSPYRTDADDIAEEIGNRTNKSYVEGTFK